MHFVFVLFFASITICLYCGICNIKHKSKVAPEDCEKGTIVSQKYVKSQVINLGTFNNTEITKVIKIGLKPKINPNKKVKVVQASNFYDAGTIAFHFVVLNYLYSEKKQ